MAKKKEVSIDVVSPSKDLQVVLDAFNGAQGDDQCLIAEMGIEIIATLLRKNKDYGSSVFKRPAYVPDLPAGAAILVRKSDKLQRLAHLMSSNKTPEVAESIIDTMKDDVGYGILWLVNLERGDNEE